MIFLVKGFLPSPTADFLVIFEALLVGLSFLILGRGGATYVEMVNGLLQTPVKLSLAPFSLLLALFFGVQVDAYASLLSVKNSEARSSRLDARPSLRSATTALRRYNS